LLPRKRNREQKRKRAAKKIKEKMAENEVNESPRWFFYALIIDIIPLLPSSPGL